MKINEKIYSLRKEKGLSQEELASELNVSRQTVSKWETGESSPDFDKIVPLCELFGISTEELLRGKKVEGLEVVEGPNKKKALLVCVSIVLYFAAISFIVLGDEFLNLNDGLLVSIFLMLIALATGTLVYTCMTMPGKKREENEEKKKENQIEKTVIGSLALITTGIYLLISFSTGAWHLTWIIWLIFALIARIIKLVFYLKEEKHE